MNKFLVIIFLVVALPATTLAADKPTAQQSVGYGNHYYQLKDYEKAASWYKYAGSIDPNNFLAFQGLGYSNYTMGKFADALAALQKAHSLKPDSQSVNQMLAKVNEKVSSNSDDIFNSESRSPASDPPKSDSTSSGVGFEVEPYLGYGFAGSLGVPNVTADSYSGFALGLRASVKFLGMFFAGPDLLFFPGLSYTPANSTTSLTNNPTMMKFGLIAGIRLPSIPLRFWLGYNFVDNASISGTVSGNNESLSFSGSSFKLGASYDIFDYLRINAEFITGSYGSATGTVNAVSASESLTGSNSPGGKVFIMSLGVPINF